MSNWQHLHDITCSTRHSPIGYPGCVCKVVNKYETKRIEDALRWIVSGINDSLWPHYMAAAPDDLKGSLNWARQSPSEKDCHD